MDRQRRVRSRRPSKMPSMLATGTSTVLICTETSTNWAPV